MSRTISHQFTLKHAPEKVWQYLTDSELIASWLMANDFKPVVGHKFRFRTKPMPRFGFDGIVHCEVLELVEFKRLTYSWKGGPLDTVVEWTLIPQGQGTLLKLEHKGFRGIKAFLPYVMMNRGWAKIGKTIAEKIKRELV